nr:dual specificity protein kinase YAK1 homolog isoform X2 [Quercus suber]
MTTDFSKSMHLGSAEPLVGVGRFNPALSTSSILSVQRQNGPVQAFPHLEVGSPPSAHDPHSGYGRSMSKTSHFMPHISQNSPSRLGQQQPGQRFNYGRSTKVRIGEWNHMKVQPPPASFNSGGPRSPGNSSFNNGMSWGTS